MDAQFRPSSKETSPNQDLVKGTRIFGHVLVDDLPPGRDISLFPFKKIGIKQFIDAMVDIGEISIILTPDPFPSNKPFTFLKVYESQMRKGITFHWRIEDEDTVKLTPGKIFPNR